MLFSISSEEKVFLFGIVIMVLDIKRDFMFEFKAM